MGCSCMHSVSTFQFYPFNRNLNLLIFICIYCTKRSIVHVQHHNILLVILRNGENVNQVGRRNIQDIVRLLCQFNFSPLDIKLPKMENSDPE